MNDEQTVRSGRRRRRDDRCSRSTSRRRPERLWEAITDPEMRAKYSFGVETRLGLDAGLELRGRRSPASIDIAAGENLEVDPPRRLVQSFNALWSDDVKAAGTSRVTWEIEPVGDSCRLTVTHDQLPDGRQRRALRRLADDPLRPEDAAGDRRDARPRPARCATPGPGTPEGLPVAAGLRTSGRAGSSRSAPSRRRAPRTARWKTPGRLRAGEEVDVDPADAVRRRTRCSRSRGRRSRRRLLAAPERAR